MGWTGAPRRAFLTHAGAAALAASVLGAESAHAQSKEELLNALLNARSSAEFNRIGDQLIALYQRNIAEQTDPVYLAAARLDLYSAYANGLGRPAEGRWEACRALLRRNGMVVRLAHRPIWTVSRNFLAALYRNVADRGQLREFLSEATRAANDAYDNIEDLDRATVSRFEAYRSAIVVSLINGRLGEARERFATAMNDIPAIVAAQHDERLGAERVESGYRDDVAAIYQLGAFSAAKSGDFDSAWRWFEASKQLSSDAAAYSEGVIRATSNAAAQAAACLETFDAVAALVQCDAGAVWLLTWKGSDGGVRTRIIDVVTNDGAPFDVVSENTLLYGGPWMRRDYGVGGWMLAVDYEMAAGGAGGDRFRQQLAVVAQTLWSICGRSLVAALDEAGLSDAAKVAVLTPEQIALLPMELAWSADQSVRGARYAISSVNSIELLVANVERRVTPQRRVVGLFNPAGDLPFAEFELQLLRRNFGTAGVTRATAPATPSAFWRQIAQSQASYVWLAAHGSFALGGQEDAGLLIAPNKHLTLADIRTANFVIPPRLVVLSACQTAQIRPRFGNQSASAPLPSSWPSALVQAGAMGVVASHWRVSDVSTALFFARMLDLHVRQGQAPMAAFRDAQTWLRTSSADVIVAACEDLGGGLSATAQRTLDSAISTVVDAPDQNAPFGHPYYWAAFSYFGV